jgi:TPR repeat protein
MAITINLTPLLTIPGSGLTTVHPFPTESIDPILQESFRDLQEAYHGRRVPHVLFILGVSGPQGQSLSFYDAHSFSNYRDRQPHDWPVTNPATRERVASIATYVLFPPRGAPGALCYEFVYLEVNPVGPTNMGEESRLIIRASENPAPPGDGLIQEQVIQAQKDLVQYYSTQFYSGKLLWNSSKFVFWLTRLAEQGDVDAQYNLGERFQYGTNAGLQIEEAIHWLTRAATQGHSLAQTTLGCGFLSGTHMARNDVEAVRWFTEAANQGQPWGQYELGRCLRKGVGTARNDREAVRWFTEAAKGNPSAQYALEMCLKNGIGIAKNEAEAVHWFTLAANQGLTWAQYELGVYLRYGIGAPHDIEKAIHWFTQSAAKGNRRSMSHLGNCYERGDPARGIPTDMNKALDWYRRAANLGEPQAFCDLGYCYSHGLGVGRDLALSMEYYNLAEAQGHQDTRKEPPRAASHEPSAKRALVSE